ncbi:MAG: glycosyltransferase [Gammaproteobacteria bacterium]|nr:glycosyltransferase [Gammaproteobacteria bacterium]
MLKANLVIMAALAALTISLFALLNRPAEEPVWPARVQGVAFSPFRADQSPFTGNLPSAVDIDADLALLQDKIFAVRTYTLEGDQIQIPHLAQARGINVALGIWIDDERGDNEDELQRLFQVANKYRNVVRVIVGNEVVLRGDIPIDEMIAYLDRVREKVRAPVSTAEPWHVWLKYPELVNHVDYLAVHMLPYWEGVSVSEAVEYVVARFNELRTAFPDKPIVITEVGWPSNGRIRKGAVASEANEAIFLRQFLARAQKEKYVYYIMEAFDQPWKTEAEGSVGAYWGVYNVDRQPKFAFNEPVVKVPNWRILAGISVALSVFIFALLLLDSNTLRKRGRGFLALVVYTIATASVWIIYDYTHQYLTLGTIIVGILLLIGMTGVMVVLLAEAHEWVEAHWVKSRRRDFRPVSVDLARLPLVSIHVPAYNEPPAMVIETLNALARLDYPRYEVILIDNNTKDPNVWQPVQAHCAKLGEHFRFFHVDPMSGFKAGALNFALQQTAPEAQIIAVIDSDYTVEPNWLRDLAPAFLDRPRLAIVQAPQDYRDGEQSAFKAMCYTEYAGFFQIGMITRNERNAIIQHGTMTLIRRTVLEEVGGWAQWCITEDAELGLRIFESGYEALYLPKSYGRGLMPDNFADYKKQRFRWAYGSVQIMRRHLNHLMHFSRGPLSYGQRYHFVAGWLPWLADSMNFLFNLAALGWSIAMIVAPRAVDPPLIVFSILPLALFSFKIAKLVYLYRVRIKASVGQTIAAAVAGLALSHTISLAMLSGFITTGKPFFRTPKCAHNAALLKALLDCRDEVILMLALWTTVFGVALRQDVQNLDLLLWIIVLLVQSVPYLAALVVSLISALPSLPARLIGDEPANPQLPAHALGPQSSHPQSHQVAQ